MRAIVTAGGTSEPIDDVRVVTNLSTGRFGAALATALADRGVEVTLIASKALCQRPHELDPRVRVVPFGSTVELRDALLAETAAPPELLFMAAAVSDYAPPPVDGKIRSTMDELSIQMTRTPKILPTLRDRCPDTRICGFKLLSGVSVEELIDTARGQITKARTDLCVANDLQELGGGQHPAWIVTAEHSERVVGTKADTAAALATFVLRDTAARGDVVQADDTVTLHIASPEASLLDPLSDTLDHHGRPVRTADPAPWVARGWQVVSEGPLTTLRPPSQRDDLLPAASVGLYDPVRQELLLGRRTAGAYLDHWAFPGGGVEAGETPLQAALRELEEETGLHVTARDPELITPLTVGTGPRAWFLTHFLVEVDIHAEGLAEPRDTTELEARWFPLHEALDLQPVATGTDRILRRLAEVLIP